MTNPIIQLSVKLGDKFTGENLNTEFKKFTLTKPSCIEDQSNEYKKFLDSGIITQSIQNLLNNEIDGYIEEYVPKYISCFFNMKSEFTNLESYLFIGIDDDGTFSGIPINTSLLSFNELIQRLQTKILDAIDEKIIKNNNVTNEDIVSCIKPEILFFGPSAINKSYSDEIDNAIVQIQKYNEERAKIAKEIEIKKQHKGRYDYTFNSMTNEGLRNNDSNMKKLIKYISRQDDFGIEGFDMRNNDHIEFIAKCLKSYNKFDHYQPYNDYIKNLYIVDGQNNLIKRNINEFIPFIDTIPEKQSYLDMVLKTKMNLQRALKINLHEIIKKLTPKAKEKINAKRQDMNKELAKLQNHEKFIVGRINVLYDNFKTHMKKIIQHNENNFIIIRIIFKHTKFQTLLKDKYSLNSHNVGYVENEKNIYTQRTLKYIGNQLDPECTKMS